jgi:glucuronoarabinoxylan endo-1,4-beta-xylanase
MFPNSLRSFKLPQATGSDRSASGVLWRLCSGLAALAIGTFIAYAVWKVSPSAHIAVDWGTTYQTIDGFGASSAGDVDTLSPGLMDIFYATSNSDLGLDFIRLKIYPNLTDCEGDEGAGNCAKVAAGPTLSTPDLANAQAAIARGARVVAGEWSPPGPMKTSGGYQGGGAFKGDSSNYSDLASLQAAFVDEMAKTYHIPIYALSPQNEPDVIEPYPTCSWTAQQYHDYVPYLAAALAKTGHSDVKILIAEKSTWATTYDTVAMNDPAVAADIAILAEHAYGSSASRLTWNNFTHQHIWQTEVSDFGPHDGSIKNALIYAKQIHDWLTVADVNAWFWWALKDDQGETHNCCLGDLNGTIAKRAYAIGNWSRFVGPGWQRIGVTNSGPLLITAFKGPKQQFAVVVVNNRRWPVWRQTFTLSGVTARRAPITPWLTSAKASLTPQPAVSLNAAGTAFTYSLPARSIVTFQGQGD